MEESILERTELMDWASEVSLTEKWVSNWLMRWGMMSAWRALRLLRVRRRRVSWQFFMC